ncbi:exported hypothetical protein [Gammaproteobacteria bacterium]
MNLKHLRLVSYLAIPLMALSFSGAFGQSANCSGASDWVATTTYSTGAQVVYQSGLYQALTTTTNVPPSYCPACGWWQLMDSCATTTTASCTTIPGVPDGLTSPSQSSNGVTLTWNTATAGAHCQVTYKLYQNGSQVASPSTNTATLTGLLAGTSYSFSVAAVDQAGTSGQSNSLTLSTNSEQTSSGSGCSGISAWVATTSYPAGAQVSYQGGYYQALSGTTNVQPSYCPACGWWKLLNHCTTTTPTCTAIPGVPVNLTSPTQSSGSLTLTWSEVAVPTYCTVTYQLYQNGTRIQTLAAPGATVANLAADTRYAFAVAAVDQAGSSALTSALAVNTQTQTGGQTGGQTRTLTLGEVANPNGRFFSGYYPTWSDNWFSVKNWDGSPKSDNDIYNASNLAKVPGVYTHIKLAFAQPNLSWGGLQSDSWVGTGLNFNAKPSDIKEVVRLLHTLKRKVILAVGGATYNQWAPLAAEAGVADSPTKAALTRLMMDVGFDGLDVDYEIDGADPANIDQYARVIQSMREAVDDAGPGHWLTLAAWSTGADYTTATASDPGYPGTPSYWGGGASRERQTFKVKVARGSLMGRTIVSLFDAVDIMAYDAQTYHYDPVTAYDQYRAIVPASIPVSIGLEIPPEGWAGGLLVINNSDSGADGTLVVADQYGRTPRGPYSVERFAKTVLNNQNNANPHDGLMLWQIQKTQSVAADAALSANATSVAQKIIAMFGYIPVAP